MSLFTPFAKVAAAFHLFASYFAVAILIERLEVLVPFRLGDFSISIAVDTGHAVMMVMMGAGG